MITHYQGTNTFHIKDEAYISKSQVDAMLAVPHEEGFSLRIENCDCVEKEAFFGIKGVSSIHFKDVESIDERAFKKCKNLLTATFDNVIHISTEAFMHTGLNEIRFFRNLNYIGINAFACTKLKRISFANSSIVDPCLFINSRAFADIKYIKEFNLPRQLKMLGNKVFERTEIEQFGVDTGINFNEITGLYGAFTDANIHTLAYCKGLRTEVISEYAIPDEKMLLETLKENSYNPELF